MSRRRASLRSPEQMVGKGAANSGCLQRHAVLPKEFRGDKQYVGLRDAGVVSAFGGWKSLASFLEKFRFEN